MSNEIVHVVHVMYNILYLRLFQANKCCFLFCISKMNLFACPSKFVHLILRWENKFWYEIANGMHPNYGYVCSIFAADAKCKKEDSTSKIIVNLLSAMRIMYRTDNVKNVGRSHPVSDVSS